MTRPKRPSDLPKVNDDVKLPIEFDRGQLAEFCRRHHIVKLAFFGSVLRDDFQEDSDVDVLVQFAPGKTPGWEFFDMQEELASIIGRRVDLNTPGDLSPAFRDHVVHEARAAYVEA